MHCLSSQVPLSLESLGLLSLNSLSLIPPLPSLLSPQISCVPGLRTLYSLTQGMYVNTRHDPIKIHAVSSSIPQLCLSDSRAPCPPLS